MSNFTDTKSDAHQLFDKKKVPKRKSREPYIFSINLSINPELYR